MSAKQIRRATFSDNIAWHYRCMASTWSLAWFMAKQRHADAALLKAYRDRIRENALLCVAAARRSVYLNLIANTK